MGVSGSVGDTGRVTPRDLRWRIMRAVPAASVVTAGAVAAHTLGGAPLPDAPVIIRTGLITLMVCLLVVGVRMGPARLILAVAVGHLSFHHLFTRYAALTQASHAPHHAHTADHAHHATTIASTTPSESMIPHDVMAAHDTHVPSAHAPDHMLMMHVVLALLTVLLLHCGESLLHRSLRAARDLAQHVLPALPLPPAMLVPCRVPLLPTALPLVRRQHPALSLPRWRGPPLLRQSCPEP